MLFNSTQFLLFLPVVVALFFVLPHRLRWGLLLAASYYFYMCWKPEFLVLILFATGLNWFAARRMEAASSGGRRRLWLVIGVSGSLTVLGFFKYWLFFTDSVEALAGVAGLGLSLPAWKLALPVGISFYTFQTLSYTIDVYRGERTTEPHLGIFALYVAFFPQLVAGPIERSTRLLPQFHKEQAFNPEHFRAGLGQIAYGLFQKMVIADRLALVVDPVYKDPGSYDAGSLWLATFFFSIQIYCDFAGYTRIAIGTARLMGYDLMENFRRPYFAQSIGEFWHRWHISLSTWFRDYVYIPLGGNRGGRTMHLRNLLIVFVVSGLWHGANWTFVLWGFVHGLWLCCSVLAAPIRARLSMPRLLTTALTFVGVLLAWVLFRAASIGDAGRVYLGMLGLGGGSESLPLLQTRGVVALILALGLLLVEARTEWGKGETPTGMRWLKIPACGLLLLAFVLLADFGGVSFIYFQF